MSSRKTGSARGSSSAASTHDASKSSNVVEAPDVAVEVFDSDWEVFQARNPPSPDAVKDCGDCLRFTKHPTRSDYYISTPNVEFIPQLPLRSSKVQYYEDGMLASLEFFKWPQEYDEKCSFACAAPGNPDLLLFKHQSFFLVDSSNVLPQFKDVNAPWFHIRQRHFETSAVFPTGIYGRLQEVVLNRMQAALLEVVAFVEKSATKVAGQLRKLEVDEQRERERRAAQERHTQCEKLQTRMRQSFMKLFAGDMTPFETMLMFREFQRMLLALRGWVVYADVLWPRLLDASGDFRFNPLPLRGVFSDNDSVVREMYRIGVPVWSIRPARSFMKWTVVVRSTPFVPVRMAFSTTTVMRLGEHNLNAPAWLREAEDDDPLLSSLIEKLEKMSISNHALIHATSRYDPTVATALFRNTVERSFDLNAGAPSLPMSLIPDKVFGHIANVGEAIAVIDSMIEREEDAVPAHVDDPSNDDPSLSQPGSSRVESGLSSPSFPVDSSPMGPSSAPVAGPSVAPIPGPSYLQLSLPPRPNALLSHPLAASLSRLTAAGESYQSSQRRVAGDSGRRANQPVERAEWVPTEAAGWGTALRQCDFVDHAEERLLYAIPSPHMFYRYASNSHTACRMLHNWLRIRRWCLRQIEHGAQQGRVLMTREEWRIALDGNYYQLVDLDPSKCRPLASAEEIALLPLRPQPMQARNRVEGEKPSKRRRIDNNHNDRKVEKRLETRVDINVRFGVHAGFPPHSETTAHKWGGCKYTAEQLNGKGNVWGEIAWELALVSFRLEFMQVDRALCSSIYNQPDGAWERTHLVANVWSKEGWVVPPWTYKVDEDLLSSEQDNVRNQALARFARIMTVWPSLDWSDMHPMQRLLATSPDKVDTSQDVAIFTFYIRSAHLVLGRLPTIPLCMPSSLQPTAAGCAIPNSFEGLHAMDNGQLE